MVLVRLLLLLAAVALGLTPAAAHGGYGGATGAVHCVGLGAATADAGHVAHGDHTGQPTRTLAPIPAPCLCAMVTTLAPGLAVPAPRTLADVRPTAAVPPLEGRSPPPDDRPPRA